MRFILGAQKVSRRCMEGMQKVCRRCTESAWKVCGKCAEGHRRWKVMGQINQDLMLIRF